MEMEVELSKCQSAVVRLLLLAVCWCLVLVRLPLRHDVVSVVANFTLVNRMLALELMAVVPCKHAAFLVQITINSF